MLPSSALVHSIEMVRDGGSLAAVFQGGNGAEYWLLFEVELRDLASGEVERLGSTDNNKVWLVTLWAESDHSVAAPAELSSPTPLECFSSWRTL